MLHDCIEIIKDLVGWDYLYFDAAIQVKTSPHSFPFCAWGACVSPEDELYIMDNNEEWHSIKEDSTSSSLVINSLYQRLQYMRVQYAKAS